MYLYEKYKAGYYQEYYATYCGERDVTYRWSNMLDYVCSILTWEFDGSVYIGGDVAM